MAAPPNLQRHIAWASVAPTTLRGMLKVGGRRTVCAYLSDLKVMPDAVGDYSQFLDASTSELARKIGGSWGPARKAINLFMRDMTYNYWFRIEAGLYSIERELEVPLDGKTMAAIAKCAEGIGLRPVRVISLDQRRSEAFQNAAAAIAKARGIARVHLDLDWWSAQASD